MNLSDTELSHSSDSVSLKITVILSCEPLAHHCISLWVHEKHGNRGCITLYVVLITYHNSPCLLFYCISERVKCVISCYCPSNVIHIVYIYIYVYHTKTPVCIWRLSSCAIAVSTYFTVLCILSQTPHTYLCTHTRLLKWHMQAAHLILHMHFSLWPITVVGRY